jgi:hypothetical protein
MNEILHFCISERELLLEEERISGFLYQQISLFTKESDHLDTRKQCQKEHDKHSHHREGSESHAFYMEPRCAEERTDHTVIMLPYSPFSDK